MWFVCNICFTDQWHRRTHPQIFLNIFKSMLKFIINRNKDNLWRWKLHVEVSASCLYCYIWAGDDDGKTSSPLCDELFWRSTCVPSWNVKQQSYLAKVPRFGTTLNLYCSPSCYFLHFSVSAHSMSDSVRPSVLRWVALLVSELGFSLMKRSLEVIFLRVFSFLSFVSLEGDANISLNILYEYSKIRVPYSMKTKSVLIPICRWLKCNMPSGLNPETISFMIFIVFLCCVWKQTKHHWHGCSFWWHSFL